MKACAKYLVSIKGNRELPVWAVRETTTAALAKGKTTVSGAWVQVHSS